MALPSSGSPIKFSQIRKEFGVTPNKKLGEYRISQDVGDMSGLPLDDGIPQGDSQISFSQFYGTQLNIVVEYDQSENRPKTAKQKFTNNEECTVIGGFKSKPNSSDGSRIIIHTSNGANIGGTQNNNTQNKCSLRTGSGWEGTTELDIVIGSQSNVYGSGGNGGKGGAGDTGSQSSASGEDGLAGGSAIGIQYPVDTIKVQSGAQVNAGGGGGGGSGGAKNDQHTRAGSGGGGGAGLPPGERGVDGDNAGGQNGQDGTTTDGGDGGDGDTKSNNIAAGGGGGGGAAQAGEVGEGGIRGIKDDDNAQDGFDGTTSKGGDGGDADAEGGSQTEGLGGSGGLNGYAITSTNNYAINVTVGDNRVHGTKQQNGGVT